MAKRRKKNQQAAIEQVQKNAKRNNILDTDLKNDRQIKKPAVENVANKLANEIIVKNAEGDPDTKATILVQNELDFVPKISVIIPVYNTEKYLRECLESVMNQSLKEIEIICVDDGSSDKSLEILKEFAARDKRISVLSQENLFAGVARNAGMMVAKGEYLHFMDSDDWLEAGAYEKCSQVLDNDKELDFVEFGFHVFDEKEQKITWSHRIKNDVIFIQQINNSLDLFKPNPWGKIIRKSIVSNLKFSKYKSTNDLTFIYSLISKSNKVSIISNEFINYRINQKDNTSAKRGQSIENFIYAYADFVENIKNTEYLKNNYNEIQRKFSETLTWEFQFCNNLDDYFRYLALSEKILGKEFISLYTNELVSIIIPVYNVEKYIQECIESVINQTYKNLEIIFIDDKSPDNSLQIIEKYAKNDKRIKIIKNEKNVGLGASRNIGVKAATGKYIQFLDSDDFLELDCVFKCVRNIQLTKSNFVLFSMKTIDDKTKVIANSYYHSSNCYGIFGKDTFTYINISNHIFKRFYAVTKLYDKKFFIDKELFFMEDIIFEDTYTHIKALLYANKISCIRDAYYIYRINRDDSIMNDSKNNSKVFDFFKVLDKLEKLIIQDKKFTNITNQYYHFIYEQLCFHLSRVSPEIFSSLYAKTIEYLNNKMLVKNKIFKNLSYLDNKQKSILLVEINDYHIENTRSFALFFIKLGYKVDVLLINKLHSSNAFFDIANANLSIKYLYESEITHYLNSKEINKYILCLFSSGTIYMKKKCTDFFINNIEVPLACLEHRLENLCNYNSVNISKLTLERLGGENTYNYHALVDIDTHFNYKKNNLVKFIVVGNIEQKRRDYCNLIQAVKRLHIKNIHNFKIVLVGKGKLDIPSKLANYFEVKGRLDYEDLYKQIKQSDFILALLNPTIEDHLRYIDKGVTGSLYLSLSFLKPMIINSYFANAYKMPQNTYFNEENLEQSIYSAIKMSNIDYISYVNSINNYKSIMIYENYQNLRKVILDSNKAKFVSVNSVQSENVCNINTARIDVKNMGGVNNSVEILPSENIEAISTSKSNGYRLNTTREVIKFRAIKSGKIVLEFKNEFENITFNQISINGKNYLQNPIKPSKYTPIRLEKLALNGQKLVVKIDYKADLSKASVISNLGITNAKLLEIIKQNYENLGNLFALATRMKNHLASNNFRIDIKNNGDKASFEVLNKDELKSVTTPKWFLDDKGQGVCVVAENGVRKIKLKAIGDGVAKFKFMNEDFKGTLSKRPAIFVDYKSVKINGKEIEHNFVASHDKAKFHEIKVKNNDIIELEISTTKHTHNENELKEIASAYANNKANELLELQNIDYENVLNGIANTKHKLAKYSVDIRNVRNASNNISLLNNSALDKQFPAWFANAQGKGCVLSSSNFNESFFVKAIGNGKMMFRLMGIDKRYGNERFPIFADFASFKINGKEYINDTKIVWHDDVCSILWDVQDGDILSVQIKRIPHPYTDEELKQMLAKLGLNNAKEVAKIAKDYQKLLHSFKPKTPSKFFSITKEKYKTRIYFLGLKYVHFNARRELLDLIKSENKALRNEINELKKKIK